MFATTANAKPRRTVADYKASEYLPHNPEAALPAVKCGRCRLSCQLVPVAVKGNRNRSRCVYACASHRCRMRGIIVHRTPSYDNQTGY